MRDAKPSTAARRISVVSRSSLHGQGRIVVCDMCVYADEVFKWEVTFGHVDPPTAQRDVILDVAFCGGDAVYGHCVWIPTLMGVFCGHGQIAVVAQPFLNDP